MLSKHYKSTKVDRRTWLRVPSGTPWSTYQVVCVKSKVKIFAYGWQWQQRRPWGYDNSSLNIFVWQIIVPCVSNKSDLEPSQRSRLSISEPLSWQGSFMPNMDAIFKELFPKSKFLVTGRLTDKWDSVNPHLQTRHVFVKHRCPRWQQSQNMSKMSKSYILTPPHPPGDVMSVKCEEPIDKPTVQVWLLYHHPNFKYWTLFVSGTELRTDKQTDGKTDGQTGEQTIFQAGGIKSTLNVKGMKLRTKRQTNKCTIQILYDLSGKGIQILIVNLKLQARFVC